MIVDIHRHMWSMDQRFPSSYEGVLGWEPVAPTDFDWQTTTDSIIAEMSEARVDVSVLFVADFAPRLGEAPFDIEVENQFVGKAQKRYPGQLIAFYGIDPRRESAPELFEKAVTSGNVKGIKLHPTVGYSPSDPICYPLYEICAYHGLPVIYHSGPMAHPLLYSRFTHPFEFDQVAADFPNLNLIMGHAFGDWWREGLVVFGGKSNVTLELSGWQRRLMDDPEATTKAVVQMRDELGVERIVWGTDFPSSRRHMSLERTVAIFRDIPVMAKKHGLQFASQEIDAILGGNAAHLLGLE